MNIYRPEFVLHEQTGFLVDCEEELCRKLDLLLENEVLRQKFSAAAAEHSRRFDWNDVTRSWENAFETVVTEEDLPYPSKRVCTQAEPR